MSIPLDGVITDISFRSHKVRIYIGYVTDENEEGKAVFFPGLKFLNKISKIIGKTVDEFRAGLIGKKIEVVIG